MIEIREGDFDAFFDAPFACYGRSTAFVSPMKGDLKRALDSAKNPLYRDHARNMPGAVQAHLYAGNLLLYRAYGWHCGNYVPYRKRATILDVLYSPAYYAWRHPWLEGKKPKWKP